MAPCSGLRAGKRQFCTDEAKAAVVNTFLGRGLNVYALDVRMAIVGAHLRGRFGAPSVLIFLYQDAAFVSTKTLRLVR
jgi:hypothetical protein